MTAYVVLDASVAIKWYVPEVYREDALALLHRRKADSLAFHVPDLFLSEVGNILWKKVRRGALEEGQAEEVRRQLQTVPMTVHSCRVWFRPALEWSCRNGHSFYDGLYVALAAGLRCRLVTADERLVRAARRSGLGERVRFVGSGG